MHFRSALAVVSLLVFANPAFAQTEKVTRTKKSETTTTSEPVVTRPAEPPVRLAESPRPVSVKPFSVGLMLGLGIPAPIKYGLNAAYTQDPNWMWELGYFTGGINFGVSKISVGGFNEALLTATGRYSPWAGSFNWIVGLSHHAYHVRLGNAIVSRLTGVGKLDVLNVQTVGLQAGVGNRWQIADNFSIGVDWVVVDIPLTTVRSQSPALEAYTNEGDRREVEEALDFMKSLWTINVLKTTIAFSF